MKYVLGGICCGLQLSLTGVPDALRMVFDLIRIVVCPVRVPTAAVTLGVLTTSILSSQDFRV